MKINQLILLVALFLTTHLVGQSTYQVTDSEITIAGTSNLHDWESKVNNTLAKGTLTVNNGVIEAINGLNVEIEVESIESPKGNIMDNKTYKALQSDKHPKITYSLSSVSSIQKKGNEFLINAKGKLTIAGTTKPIDMTVSGTVTPDGDVKFSGSKALKMTDFNVDPPTAMFGALKTGDDVTIKFSVTLSRNVVK